MPGPSEAGELVRSYSLELEQKTPANAISGNLSGALVENQHRLERQEKENAKWQEYYEEWKPPEDKADPNTKSLREQAVLLSHAWKLFRHSVPKEDQADFENRAPSVEGLVKMVDTMARNWQNKRDKSKTGRFMNHFSTFCSTLDAHSNMLEVLPNGNEYVSLFTGTLKSIIKATSNYEKIATGLGKALSEMSEEIVACEKELEIYKTEDMQKKVANFYAHVFLFLQDTMEWYQTKQRSKVLDAFREDFFTRFEDEIQNIKNFSKQIHRQALLSTMGEIRDTRLTAERIEEGQLDIRIALGGYSREQAELKHKQEAILTLLQKEMEGRHRLEMEIPKRLEKMANGIIQHLTGIAQHYIDNRVGSIAPRQQVFIGKQQEPAPRELILYQRERLLLNSTCLVEYFAPARIQIPGESVRPVSLETLAASSLSDWTKSTRSRILSIAGQQGSRQEEHQMTKIASMCVAFARKSQLPIISYFCELARNETLRTGNTRESQALIALVYSLLRQMMEELPIEFESELNLSEERFSKLDGTLKSWKEAVDIFNDLLQLMPKILLCVIDGFQWLDDRSTEKYLKEFVKLLRGGALSSNVFKVLLTTTGRSGFLLGELSQTELCLADRNGAHGSAARRGGHVGFVM